MSLIGKIDHLKMNFELIFWYEEIVYKRENLCSRISQESEEERDRKQKHKMKKKMRARGRERERL